MARTKTKPGPKPKYGACEFLHVLIPIDDLASIRSVTPNMTEWIIKAIQEKREREQASKEISSRTAQLCSKLRL